jgi:hypothetical protein
MAGTMSAAVVTYEGQDNGAPITGPFPNSIAAQQSFAVAARQLSPLGTVTFEDLPVGFQNSFTAAPGVTVTLAAPNFGNGVSGISNITFGNLFGFDTTPGGSNWLGFSEGSAEFSFANPTDYFGFWLTGVQTPLTSMIAVQFSDGTAQVLQAPVNSTGGAAFFGFTDAGKSISSVTISNLSNDAWGIDDVNYNVPSVVPEPSSMLLVGIVVLGLGAVRHARAG